MKVTLCLKLQMWIGFDMSWSDIIILRIKELLMKIFTFWLFLFVKDSLFVIALTHTWHWLSNYCSITKVLIWPQINVFLGGVKSNSFWWNKPKMAYSCNLAVMDYHGLSWMTFMDDFHGWLSWMTVMDDYCYWTAPLKFWDHICLTDLM